MSDFFFNDCDNELSFEFPGRFTFCISSKEAWERATAKMVRRAIHVFDGTHLLGTFFVDKDTATRIEAPLTFRVDEFRPEAANKNISCAAKIEFHELDHWARISLQDVCGIGVKLSIDTKLDCDDDDYSAEDDDDDEDDDEDDDDDDDETYESGDDESEDDEEGDKEGHTDDDDVAEDSPQQPRPRKTRRRL